MLVIESKLRLDPTYLNLLTARRFSQCLLEELVYDWNTIDPELLPPNRHIGFDDETLRDGLQSPSVCEPPVEKKIELLHLMDALGIDTADIGLPGAGGTHAAGVELMAREIAEKKLKIRPNCAARTHRNDIIPIVEISQRAGIPIEACTFIGSSAIRFFAEDWTLDKLLKLTEDAVTFAVSEGVPVMYVTEDTTRANPETIRALYTTAIRCGAKAVCVCDTVGHSTPDGARAVVRFVKSIIEEQGGNIRLDWHGHQDRGLGVINSIAAIQGGADQVHGSALGMGERVGNTPMDQLLVNLKLMGWIDNDLSRLGEYCEAASNACDWTIPLQLSGLWPRRFSHGNRRSCGRSDQELSKRRSRTCGPGLLGRAGGTVWAGAGGRDRSDERQVKRDLLARETRHRGERRTRQSHLRTRQAVIVRTRRRRHQTTRFLNFSKLLNLRKVATKALTFGQRVKSVFAESLHIFT